MSNLLETMLTMVVDKVNNADKKVEKRPLTLTKYRAQKSSTPPPPPSSAVPPSPEGKSKSKPNGGVVEVVPEDIEGRQLEVHTCMGLWCVLFCCRSPLCVFSALPGSSTKTDTFLASNTCAVYAKHVWFPRGMM